MKILSKKGFILIELLVVVAIIGLLASVVLTSLNSTRAKARDAKRAAELGQGSKALEFYYDSFGGYPEWSTASWGIDCAGFRGDAGTSNTFMQPLFTSGFLKDYVKDPRITSAGTCLYQYRSEKSTQAYRLLFQYETKPNNDLSCYQPGGWSCIRVNFDDVFE